MLGLFNSESLALMLTSVLSTLVTLALEVAILVAAVTVVRRNRPDAYLLIAIAPVISVCATIFSTVGYTVGARAVGYSAGVEKMSLFLAAMRVGSTLVYAASTLCLLLGILRLAKPVETRDAPLAEPPPY